MTYRVVKRYGHDQGLSCTFRQWKAEGSHCQYIHGYALAFAFTFEADSLDARNWVYDFGGLKSLKAWLAETFDHRTIVAKDDPHLSQFYILRGLGLIDEPKVVGEVSCERFAEIAFAIADRLLRDSDYHPRVRLVEVEVCEHPGNSASYLPDLE